MRTYRNTTHEIQLKNNGKNMIGDSLTIENLTAIYEAMSKIKEIDRSQYFNQYFKEVENRMKEATAIKMEKQ